MIHEAQPYDKVYEFSNWSSVEMGNAYDEDVVEVSIKFCGRTSQDIFGYFMIMEPKAAVWSLMEEGYPIKSHQTLVLVHPMHTQTLPPPYSKCGDDYPPFIWPNENASKFPLLNLNVQIH